MTRARVAAAGAIVAVALALSAPVAAVAAEGPITIGSKMFPESWILGEALATLARQSGATDVEHRNNLGGTEIVFEGVRSGDLDVYPEYTGTIAQVILKSSGRPSLDEMRAALAPQGLGISDPLGFNDGYALAVTRATHDRLGVSKLSDLAAHPELKLGFTHEFIGRPDGFPGLARRYGLSKNNVRGIQHELAYGALENGRIDVMDIYTTDAQIERMDLVLLDDDRNFFPRYDAVLLYRLELPKRAPRAFAAMERLVGKIDEARMTRANAKVVLENHTYQDAAAALVAEAAGTAGTAAPQSHLAADIGKYTLQHLRLVAISLLAAILIGVPLGVLAARVRWLAGITLAAAGLLQTVPSLALLAFLIPLFGIGVVPALIALFLYSLLPIIRNTHVGLTTMAPQLSEAAEALGLSPATHLFRVMLPLASQSIMAGIKTSAVINVGTATLAALIGAGGLGDPILTGISLKQPALILQGAIPAALLALVVQWGFDMLDRVVVPYGLRLPPPRA